MVMAAAESNIPSLADYYAGAIALLVVVLFAKLVSHAKPGPSAVRGSRANAAWWLPKAWNWLIDPDRAAIGKHWVCVLAAFVGAVASFTVLG